MTAVKRPVSRSMSSRRCRVAVLAFGGALACVALAQPREPTPWPNADAAAGKALHDKDCVACHARRFDGDAAKMYTRPDHRVRTPAQLRAQVTWCNTQLGAQYFPEDEDNVAAYLNREYYHFKP